MDRRSVLKGFGCMVGYSGGFRPRPLAPAPLIDAPLATCSTGRDERSEASSIGAGSTAATQSTGEVVRLAKAIDEVVPADATIEPVADGFGFTEGPIWIHGGY